MASVTGTEVHGHPVTRLPPHLEGNLLYHRPTKFGTRPKRAFFVLLETVIHQYESSESYHKGQRSKENFKINLEEVCGITEMLMSSKQYKNSSFKLTLNDKEATEYKFSAESRQAMEKWVNGLRDAKEFWIHHKRLEFTQKKSNGPHIDVPVTVHNEADNLDDSTSSSFTENCEPVQVSVTTWNQITLKVLLPSVFDMEELLTALSTKLQSKRCAGCPICRLQKSSMEVWIVTASGIGHKLDSDSDIFDVSKHGKHFYLLEHDHKLLIIHFEDGTFQVIPCLVSIKAKEVPYLPIFADKLSSLGFSNFGLFLVNEKGTSLPFSPEEEPLKHSFQGRLVLKNRALTISPPVSSESWEIQRQRLKKNQQDRMNQKALKIAEKEKCKHLQLCNTSKEGFSPPDGLVFSEEHYGVSGDLNPPSAALTDSIELTECIQETADGENRSAEPGAPVENFISQVGDNNSDELVPYDQTTVSSAPQKCLKKFPELSVEIATRVREGSEGSLHKHSSTLTANPSLSGEYVTIVQRKKDSLKHSEHCAEKGGSSEQMEESTKIKSVDFHKEGYLSSGCETCQTSALAWTDGSRGKAAAASTSGDEVARVEHDLRVNELVNCANKTTFGGEPSVEKETIGYESNKDQHAGANEEMAAENGSSENHIETKIPGTASSDVVTLSAQDETPSDKRKCTENLARPLAVSVGSTEIHEKFRFRSVLVDKWNDGPYSSCICHERLPAETHHCDYAIMSSPRVLKIVLKAWSGHKANEEEVGEANKFPRICLSGWHLRCESGSWIVVEQGPSQSDCDTPAVKIQLSKRLDAFFHKEERLWTVVENVHVAYEPKDMKNQIQNQDVSDIFAGTENTSNNVTPQDQSVTSDLSPRNALQDIGITSGDEAQEVAKTLKTPGRCIVVPNSRTESPNQGALHSAIQQICEKMTTFRRSAKDALGDTKYETIIEIICKSLCSALWDLLSVGLRKRFIGKYTVWTVVQEFKDISGHVCQTVDWVNNKYTFLGETQKFQAFVCECLTIGDGALHHWLKGLFRQNEKKLTKYYNQDGIVLHFSRERLEELVSDLSRISSLRFDLNFESWIRTKGYDLNKAAFAFE